MAITKADSTTLKRSFTPDIPCNSSVRAKLDQTTASSPFREYSSRRALCKYGRPRSKGLLGRPGQPCRTLQSMPPVQTSSRSFTPMPSFQSVFGEEDYSEANTTSHGKIIARPASSGAITLRATSGTPFSIFHAHRDSTSTSASESSDSSPTTTISTMDSSSMTEPSPATSPESPHAKMLPSSFVADFRSRREPAATEPTQSSFFELQRPTTPAKKPRNLKNLAVKTSSLLNTGRAASTASLPTVAKEEGTTSAPESPLFIKPPTPRRRPSNLGLTLQTPGGQDSKPMRLVIPSTPSFNRPALRHFQSSPSLPLCSPSVAPSGGMQFPSLRPLKTNPHGFAEVPIEMEEEDQEPNFDIPQSREEKPAAYPNGPICIYESGVYLYFEPTAEQASKYDVIFNVASEVKNPFAMSSSVGEDSLEDLEARRRDGKPTKKQATPSTLTDTQDSSPTTPRATPISEHSLGLIAKPSSNNPEYIHIPWEHNTDIVPDLYKLVQVIDDRVQHGKRVLVHCQCGVSRSASLIVAYGLFKNPGISVQEAYDAVKKRSRWIGPNMNLIMQLQEFRNGLLRANGDRAFHNQVYGLALPRKSAGLPSATGTTIFELDQSDSGSRTPRTAPLPPENDSMLQRASTGNMIDVSPGPLTAPSGGFFSPGFRRSWASSQTQTNFDAPATPYVDPKGHVVPVVALNKVEDPATQATKQEEESAVTAPHTQMNPPPMPNFSRRLNANRETLDLGAASGLLSPRAASFEAPQAQSNFSPRSTEFHMSPLKQASDDDSFGLTSPRAITFKESPMSHPPTQQASLLSPRSTEFHMTPVKQDDFDASFGLLSPRSTSFETPQATSFSSKGSPMPQESAQETSLLSPRATEFHMTPFEQDDFDASFGLLSPRAAGFDALRQAPEISRTSATGESSPSDMQISTSSGASEPAWTPHQASALSPRSSEFHMTAWRNDDFDDTYGLLSPKATSFNLEVSPVVPQSRPSPDPSVNSISDFGSPRTAEFPRNTMDNAPATVNVTSPRSTEFHMIPLKPRVADDDAFGLMSPRNFEFSKNPFEGSDQKPIPIRQHHPIHPPAHLSQPESENGFTSLNGSANFKYSAPTLSPPPTFKLGKPPIRIDSLSSSPETHALDSDAGEAVLTGPTAADTKPQIHLATPLRQNPLRTRYSSPNLQESRRLHKLQTEMKAMLPPRSPNLPPAVDDTEALMSPRATEFTMNPFHVDLANPGEDASPASSTETIKAGQDYPEGLHPGDDAPKSLDEDPRSPAQKGVSPIVRSIFDVL